MDYEAAKSSNKVVGSCNYCVWASIFVPNYIKSFQEIGLHVKVQRL